MLHWLIEMEDWECPNRFAVKEEIVCKNECEVIIDVLEDDCVNIDPCAKYCPDSDDYEENDATYDKKSDVKQNNMGQKSKRNQQSKSKMRYGCIVCNYKTGNSTNFKIHLRTHTGEKPYKCEQCDYRAKVLCALYRHKRVHTGERPYACPQCEYRAAQPSHLARHKMIHTGERPHACTQCNYSASQMSHLVRHMSVHNNFRPYPCNECPYRAKRKSHLQKHLNTHEKERKNSIISTRELRVNRRPKSYSDEYFDPTNISTSSCKLCEDIPHKMEITGCDRSGKHIEENQSEKVASAESNSLVNIDQNGELKNAEQQNN